MTLGENRLQFPSLLHLQKWKRGMSEFLHVANLKCFSSGLSGTDAACVSISLPFSGWSYSHKASYRASHHPVSSWTYCRFCSIHWDNTITSTDKKWILLPKWPTDPCNMQLMPEYFASEPEDDLLSCPLTDRSIVTGSSDHLQSPFCSLPFSTLQKTLYS